MLRQHGDAMRQTEIVKQYGSSKSKTSALLTNMRPSACSENFSPPSYLPDKGGLGQNSKSGNQFCLMVIYTETFDVKIGKESEQRGYTKNKAISLIYPSIALLNRSLMQRSVSLLPLLKGLLLFLIILFLFCPGSSRKGRLRCSMLLTRDFRL